MALKVRRQPPFSRATRNSSSAMAWGGGDPKSAEQRTSNCQVLVVAGLMICACLVVRYWYKRPGSLLEATVKHWSIEANCPSIQAENQDLLGSTCAICLQTFLPLENVRRLPCGHCFHATCIDRWFQQSKTCPMCNQDCSEILQWTCRRRQDRERTDEELSSLSESAHCCGREESRSLIRDIEAEDSRRLQ
eukprot:TRINITY_DN13299_c0_g1_i1.p1 TRINITY_DN13299_c0_g1~~TRINITY_DN13299_c0_g1_i1.p1  ORF type:complete len:191 (-),score=20.52 TRINITY_DN13299_c0_g1_i1:260-832(-)